MNEHLQNKKIGFVGGGMMGGAVIEALVRKLGHPKEAICIGEPSEKRRQSLTSDFGVRTVADNQSAVEGADIIVLAVKPQMLTAAIDTLKAPIHPDALVISIMAGVSISNIQAALSHDAVVRTMPNTPAQIGEGMTVWTASDQVTDKQRDQAATILRGMGRELYVHHEDALNMATAICGSGPAYIFLFMEAMVDAAVQMGLSRTDAVPLVLQTVIGSAKTAAASERHLAELRNMVTSPGGTTAEALYQLEKGSLRTVVSDAIWAAYKKSRKLGKSKEDK